MLKLKSSLVALLAAFAMLAALGFGADKKQLSAALAAVEANLKTSAGKQYDEALGKEFPAKYLSSLKQCKQSSPDGAAADLDMFLKLDGEGKVQEVLVYPETPFSVCCRTALQTAKFSSPPHGDYWVNVHLQAKR
jgi:hypothetical protein